MPQAVLELLTWQELERRVCGNPEISVDALRRYSKYSVEVIIVFPDGGVIL